MGQVSGGSRRWPGRSWFASGAGLVGALFLTSCVSEPGTDSSESTVVTRSALTAFTGVLTNHNDLGRSGANLNETILNTTNVKTSFGWLTSLPVSGQIYAQPLYVAGAINGLNVLFVATEQNKVYAFNADPPYQPLWPGGFRQLESAWAPASFPCGNSVMPFGVNSTPVIDPGSNPPSTAIIYVVTKTLAGGVPKQFLHALSLADGTDRPGSPIDVATNASVTTASGATLTFDPMIQQNRVGLTLTASCRSASAATAIRTAITAGCCASTSARRRSRPARP